LTAAPIGRTPLVRDLAREQRAYLGRDRAGWAEHLARIRAFLGEGLLAARPGAPVLVTGAGSGLEVPWALAPRTAVGWDADPWSRLRTLLRHRRWVPWVFQDLTGGLEDLAGVAGRTARQPWSGRLLATPAAGRRAAGLIDTLHPGCGPLRAWLRTHRPGTILSANVMGQFGVVAQRLVERAFAGQLPGPKDPEEPDPLDRALRDWTARAVRAYLEALAATGAELWLVHDRAVLFSHGPVALGPLEPAWAAQVRAEGPLDAADPLEGVEVMGAFEGRAAAFHQRWLWPVAPGQIHVMEAIRIPSTGDS
jgi:hypothetical protein